MSSVRSDMPKRRGGRTEHPDLDRGGRAGYGSPARVTMPLNFETVSNPAELACLVQSSFDSLVNQLNTIFAEKLDKIDSQGRMLSDTYTDKMARPIRLHKVTANVDVDVEDVIDATNNDLDDLGDGSVYGRVKVTEMSGGQVKRVRDTVGGRDVTGDQIFDKGADDADDVSESTTKKWAGATGADFIKGTDDAADVGESASRKWAGASGADFVKASDDLDNVRHGTTYRKVKSVSGSNEITESSVGTGAITNTKLGADAVDGAKLADNAVASEHVAADAISGDRFTSAVQLALIDYNTDSGPGSEAAWDAV